MQIITAREALSVLDQATAKLPLDRRGNALVIKSLQTLDAFINEHDKTPPAASVEANEGPGKKKK